MTDGRAAEAIRRRARTSTGRPPAPPRPLTAWCCRAALRALSVLPLGALQGIGAALGTIASFVPGRPRATTRVNLRLAYREWRAPARARLARRSLAESGRAALELAAVWVWPVERALGLVAGTVGESCFADAAAEGRGVIVASMHLGSWEPGLLHMGRRYGAVTLFRPPRIRELEPLITAARERAGGTMVPVGPAGARRALTTLARGGVTVIVADHDPGVGAGVFAPFFGVLANTTVFISKLARHTNARVVIAWGERLSGARGVRLHFRPAGPGVYDIDPARAAEALNAELEAAIRTRPEQYVWSYKRFRIRPPGDADLYRSAEGLRQAMEPRRAS